MPLEGKEKKRKKVLLVTKIKPGDKSKSILDYVDETIKPICNNQSFIGEIQTGLHQTHGLMQPKITSVVFCFAGKRVLHMKKFSLEADNEGKEASLFVVPVSVRGEPEMFFPLLS